MASPFLDDNIQDSLVFESERLKTFFEPREDGMCGSVELWSSAADITPKELAEDGFFFRMKDDHCVCIFCGGIVGAWEKEDTVRGEHEKHFPRCPFIGDKPVGNIPMSLCEHLEPMWKHTVVKRLKGRSPSGVIYTDFSHPDKRKASFTSSFWSVNMKNKLSTAGFYSFTDIGDHVRCFRCGLGLRGWSDTMDPLKMHARYSPDCMIVKLFIEPLAVETYRHHNKVDDALVDLVIEQGDIEKHVVALGFPRDAVVAAVKKRLLDQGTKFYKVTECIEAVMIAMEQKARTEKAVAQALANVAKKVEESNMVASFIAEGRDVVGNLIAEEDYEPIFQANAAMSSEGNDDGENTTGLSEEVVLEEVKPSDSNEIMPELACKVCFCEEAVVVLLPCKHLCVCPKCAGSFEECPVCREKIVDVLKITRC